MSSLGQILVLSCWPLIFSECGGRNEWWLLMNRSTHFPFWDWVPAVLYVFPPRFFPDFISLVSPTHFHSVPSPWLIWDSVLGQKKRSGEQGTQRGSSQLLAVKPIQEAKLISNVLLWDDRAKGKQERQMWRKLCFIVSKISFKMQSRDSLNYDKPCAVLYCNH